MLTPHTNETDSTRTKQRQLSIQAKHGGLQLFIQNDIILKGMDPRQRRNQLFEHSLDLAKDLFQGRQ